VGFDSREKQAIFLFAIESRQTLGPTRAYNRLRGLEWQPMHLHLVPRVRIYGVIPPSPYVSMASLIKLRDNLTFLVPLLSY
jgi:hypothetical protein